MGAFSLIVVINLLNRSKMPKAAQPTINSQFRECRRTRRTTKKEESNTVAAVPEETFQLPILVEPEVVDLTKVKKPRGRQAKQKNELNVAKNQTRLSFQREKAKDIQKEKLDDNLTNKPQDISSDIVQKPCSLPVKAHSETITSIRHEKEDSAQVEQVFEAPRTFTKGQKQKSRSAKILASLNLEKSAEKVAEITASSEKSSVTKVKPNHSVSIVQNAEIQILRSPAKRKPEDDKVNQGEVLLSSPSKISKSTAKKELFAVDKPALDLPAKYLMLFDKFSALESSIQMLYNRKERCEFDKLVNAVQQVTSKNFGMSDLSKIVTVSPEAYKISWEKKHKCMMTKTFVWTLCLTPKFESTKEILLASDVIARKSAFQRCLIELVHNEHTAYLRKINTKLTIDTKALKRWHPKFALDAVPDITEAKLPEKPVVAEPRQGLNELILKTKEKATEKMESALVKIEAMSPKTSKSELGKADKICVGGASGISEKLLLKIQAKE